ncbi:di-heme oxidoreductase family protein [Thiothrix subterranea]|uniref:di-heme oxidoreductase family protein n=1 Tax=Thiothrix subterranea TaxID=2735563 RepID=UPI00280B0F5B|nr:di-heme oxidoredictase family protein [Thiothrix subterranea]
MQHGRGHPPLTDTENFLSTIVKLSIPAHSAAQQTAVKTLGIAPEPTYGDHLQTLGIKGLPGEGTPRFTYTEVHGQFKDGETYTLLQPQLHIDGLNYGALHPDTQFSPRVAPPLFGMGLLESIPDAEILANADPDDHNADGISGKPNQVWDIATQQTKLGRFSWKANQPSILQQTADAFRNDIGITSILFPEQPCTTAQTACHALPEGGKPEIPANLLETVVFHVAHQPVPSRRDTDDPQVIQGQKLFNQAGCVACHTPTFPALANQPHQPYSDLLLHDMGEGLADKRPDFAASGNEWRTPPLWGIGLTEKLSGHTRFLHDGRARNLLEAILWHGGEAEAAKQHVLSMHKSEREALLRFLNSL